jgi:RHH-type proline utilization regulon transcriptional repressor/proline dehydrogenase/delta 1-pyrroline-5-carboxylate dehydrogenase
MSNFKNFPPIDFTIKSEIEKISSALLDLNEDIKNQKLSALPIVNGKEIQSANTIESIDPNDGVTVIGKVTLASEDETLNAINELMLFEKEWSLSSPETRIKALRNAAKIMSDKRYFLLALIIREAGKPWKEADADIVEAIDFCNYYAELAESMFCRTIKTQENIGEQNIIQYRGKGLTTVIAPWNFPLAILCGMSVASLVSGNVTAIKPAEQTSLVAKEFVNILIEAGFPAQSFAFLPGIGEITGKTLVESKSVKQICFTGSKAVGLEIIRTAKETPEGQKHIKGVISELGGKNTIIVDDDADLDQALKGIIYSAFAFAGQKCSACSRLIIVDSAYDVLVDRLKESVKDLISGSTIESSTFLGPVIDAETQSRLKDSINKYRNGLKILCQSQVPETGFFVPATIFVDVPTDAEIWNKELFGPILAVHKAKDFDSAIEIGNKSDYALTAGVYSRSPKNIEKAINYLEAGNIYINRSCTGAIVERHPFGGYKLSGTGDKAGGVDYLKKFVVTRCISENTMRSGFTPELV